MTSLGSVKFIIFIISYIILSCLKTLLVSSVTWTILNSLHWHVPNTKEEIPNKKAVTYWKGYGPHWHWIEQEPMINVWAVRESVPVWLFYTDTRRKHTRTIYRYNISIYALLSRSKCAHDPVRLSCEPMNGMFA